MSENGMAPCDSSSTQASTHTHIRAHTQETPGETQRESGRAYKEENEGKKMYDNDHGDAAALSSQEQY